MLSSSGQDFCLQFLLGTLEVLGHLNPLSTFGVLWATHFRELVYFQVTLILEGWTLRWSVDWDPNLGMPWTRFLFS